MEDILAIVLIFGGGTAIVLSFSPLGRALADRIRGHAPVAGTDPELLNEMSNLRVELSELQERVDFTERLLARRDESPKLESGLEGGR